MFALISSPPAVWQSSRWVTLAEETYVNEKSLWVDWLRWRTGREWCWRVWGAGGAMWGWGWWLGERDERGGKVVRGAERVSHMVLIIIWRDLRHLKVARLCRSGRGRSPCWVFYFFSPHHRLPVRVSSHEPSPNVVQASRRNVDIKFKVGWVPGNVILSTELAHYGWIVVVSLLALIISHSVEALFAARDAEWFLCSWPQGTFIENRRIYVGCNLHPTTCAKMTTKKIFILSIF